jgi:hypothetical protein
LESANIGDGRPNLNGLMEWSPGSPNRDESFSGRGLSQATLGLLLNNEAAYTAFLTAKLRKNGIKADGGAESENGQGTTGTGGGGGGAGGKELEGVDLIFSDAVSWNDEPPCPPILPGLYLHSRRHDSEKQEVLAQVADLEVPDLLPILATCQFCLAIYYARALVLRLLAAFLRKYARRPPPLLTAAGLPAPLPADNGGTPQITEAVLLEKEAEIFLSSFTASTLLKFLRNSFAQAVATGPASDQLFPLLGLPGSSPDGPERVPPFHPFTSFQRIAFASAVRGLEQRFLADSLGGLLSDAPATETLRLLEQLLVFLAAAAFEATERETILLAHLHGRPAPAEEPNPSAIASSLSGLQDRILQRAVGTSPAPTGPALAATTSSQPSSAATSNLGQLANSFLAALIDSALHTLERAASSKFEAVDWIAAGLEKNPPAVPADSFLNKSAANGLAEDGEAANGLPQVLFAFWALRALLGLATQLSLGASHLFVLTRPSPGDHSAVLAGSNPLEESLLFARRSAFNKLAAPDVLTRLLKLSAGPNDSLRFVLYELSASLLALVNAAVQSTLMKDGHFLSPLPAPLKTSAASQPLSVSALAQIAAAEFYVSVAKEKRLLQALAGRVKLERNHEKLLCTRYTRAIASFLFQWFLLRRQLGLNTFSYLAEHKVTLLALTLLTLANPTCPVVQPLALPGEPRPPAPGPRRPADPHSGRAGGRGQVPAGDAGLGLERVGGLVPAALRQRDGRAGDGRAAVRGLQPLHHRPVLPGHGGARPRPAERRRPRRLPRGRPGARLALQDHREVEQP